MNLSPITGFFSSKAIPLLAGALALSAAGNAFQYFTVKHEVVKKVECVTAVKATTDAAKKTKKIVETRQEKNIANTQTSTTGRIADLTRRLHDSQSRERNLAQAQASTGGPAREGGTPLVLPDGFILVNRDTYYNDQRICVVNTAKAEDWQKFYGEQVNIWDEEYGNDSRPH